MAANPLAPEVFAEGKKAMNFILTDEGSDASKYRLMVHSGDNMSISELNTFADDFTDVEHKKGLRIVNCEKALMEYL